MKTIRKLLIAGVLIPLLIISCTEEDDEYNYQYDGEIYFTVRYDSILYDLDDYVGFNLYMVTEEQFPATLNYIEIEEEYHTDEIGIHILDIIECEVCFMMPGPAVRKIPISFESNSYKLVFYNAEYTDTYQLNVLEDSVIVTTSGTSFTIYDHERAIYP
ncbi:MAG: hypothetical protein HQ510_12130 [Candidatus Marinimicrobia bacterium]|nr:hypothetical protein [Candidatus Neomarinimicrobiota bacterium]